MVTMLDTPSLSAELMGTTKMLYLVPISRPVRSIDAVSGWHGNRRPSFRGGIGHTVAVYRGCRGWVE